MDPKLKAKQLVDRFMFISDRRIYDAKQCALICADEVYKNISYHPNYNYWKQVYREIERL